MASAKLMWIAGLILLLYISYYALVLDNPAPFFRVMISFVVILAIGLCFRGKKG